jgi:hypothetical protein
MYFRLWQCLADAIKRNISYQRTTLLKREREREYMFTHKDSGFQIAEETI